MYRMPSLKGRLAVAVVGLSLGAEFVAAVDTINTLRDNDASLQAYNDTVAAYDQAKLNHELEIQRRLEAIENRREFRETLDATREATESAMSAENGAKITIVIPKVNPLATDYDIKIPVEPEAPGPYVVPPAPEPRADFLRPGHEFGKFLYQWSLGLT